MHTLYVLTAAHRHVRDGILLRCATTRQIADATCTAASDCVPACSGTDRLQAELTEELVLHVAELTVCG